MTAPSNNTKAFFQTTDEAEFWKAAYLAHASTTREWKVEGAELPFSPVTNADAALRDYRERMAPLAAKEGPYR